MNVKILISYNKLHTLLQNDILTPIQTGRAVADEVFENMIGDDTGENISDQNPKFSELSAQYWAWKNYEKIGNPDWIGHMQYRRHFIFNENAVFDVKTPNNQLNGFSVKFISHIADNYIENIGLTEASIETALRGCDIVVVKKADMRCIGCKNAKEDFLKNVPGAQEYDYDLLMDVIEKEHPDYKDVIKQFYDEPYRYFYHMFVMKKSLFFEYNELIFPILFKLDKKIDYSRRGTRGKRVLGYLGEFLLSLFVMKKNSERYKIKEFYSTCILNDNKQISIPYVPSSFVYIANKYEINNVICSSLSFDENIITNKRENLIIFCENANHNDIRKILSLNLKNFNLYVFEIPNEPKVNNDMQCTFLRILLSLKNIPHLVFVHPRVLFAKNVDFSKYLNNSIYAAKHPSIGYAINHDTNIHAYIENIIGLKNAYYYFSDKIFILNWSDVIKKHVNACLDKIPFVIKLQQDILNFLFKNMIEYLPENFLMECSSIERKKYFTEKEFVESLKKACALYFTDANDENAFLAKNIFLRYLMKSPLQKGYLLHLIKSDVNQKPISKWTYFRYKLLAKITWGRRRKHYKQKRREAKAVLKNRKERR